MYQRIQHFINNELWRIRAKDLPRNKRIGVNVLRVVVLAIQDFNRDRCQLRASALTFYTLLTIVPVLAMAFGIAKGFGLEELLEQEVYRNFAGQEQVIEKILDFVKNTLARTQGGLVAGIGIIILLFSAVRILSNIEDTLNTIWEVKYARSTTRKITDYLSLIVFAPILMIMSGSMNVYVTSTVRNFTDNVALLENVSPLINTPLRIIPYAIVWLLLTFIYFVIPNRKVKFTPALIGGIVAGTAYQLTQWGYINFQIGVSNMNSIYGSFAALPLFLIWVQLSWILVLFGAEISYAVQTLSEHEQKDDIAKISERYKKILSLLVTHKLVKQFVAEEPALTTTEIADQLDVPPRILQDILNELLENRIITATQNEENRELSYQPARDTSKLTVFHILELLEKRGVNQLNMEESKTLIQLTEAVDSMRAKGKDTVGNLLLKDID